MKIRAKRGIKINSQRGDGHINGASFKVIGKSNVEIDGKHICLVLADDFHLPIMVVSNRVEIIDDRTDIIELNSEQLEYLKIIPEEFINLFEYEE